ncbi:helix-turn-helix transcriptional regulator [Streptomyces triticirhizae]|uniref:LuxR family transcriptional regulator n=1 Tax=Streptomyces triticirhizae TaxID=2483353 RepID=A0A3M2L4I6_9ACTN|nr:helix-turn-helix transcriptional regulator [Streptomyces triticirhizae]RMI30785.1 LuxR family transcriptional regulator [Streptomyces triticirhizae]
MRTNHLSTAHLSTARLSSVARSRAGTAVPGGDPTAAGPAPEADRAHVARAPEAARQAQVAGAPDEADDLDSALAEVRTLLETIVSRHRDLRSGQGTIVPLAPDEAGLAGRIDRLCGTARRGLAAVIAPEEEPGRLIGDALRRVQSRPEGAPRVRVLHTRAGAPPERALPDSWRRAAVPPMHLLLVDRATALIQVESPLGPHAAQVSEPTLVGTLQSLFDGLWRRSSPLASPEFDGRGGSRLARAVLRALNEGVTDEAAARELGMSVRTYRRHVAEIMARLGARSRFQAGVLAAELGLLGPHAPR